MGCNTGRRLGTGLGYAFVGGVSGALGGVVAPAVATSIGISGIVGGAIVGGTVGLTSGFTTGTGNTLVEGGGIGDALSNGVQGAIGGAVGGIVAGGIMGGAASWTKGENIWTGKPTQPVPDIRPRPANVEPDPLPKQVAPEKPMGIQSQMKTMDGAEYTVVTNRINNSAFSVEGGRQVIQDYRPAIKGYLSDLNSKGGDFHNYPRLLDADIVQHGTLYGRSGNTDMYIAKGNMLLNGKTYEGAYTIGINNQTGIIFHRCFYETKEFIRRFHFNY